LVVTVAMASVVAFLTPIGHHGNLLIYGPGRYRFRDFVKVGTPLTILCGLIIGLLAAPDLEGLKIHFLYVSGAVKMPLDARR
jgi:di/tricarboxylate transporter